MYKWMLENVEKLATLILEHRCLTHPDVDEMLTEMMYTSNKTKREAYLLLKAHLARADAQLAQQLFGHIN